MCPCDRENYHKMAEEDIRAALEQGDISIQV